MIDGATWEVESWLFLTFHLAFHLDFFSAAFSSSLFISASFWFGSRRADGNSKRRIDKN
jgi:hypothetical protein